MLNLLKFTLLILMMMASVPILASGLVLDPVSLLKTWWEINHWAGVTAAALFAAMVTATWKMPKIENETKAVMISDLFRLGRYLVGILFFIEFYEFLISIFVRIADWIL